MYAVTAWMVQPLTCSLVGTKMEKLQTNRKTKANSKNQQARSYFRKAKFMLKIIERNKQNGTPRKEDETDRIKWQAVVDEYLKTNKKMNDNSLSKDNVLKGSKANKQAYPNPEITSNTGNYFDTHCKVSGRSLGSREHMSSLTPLNCVPYEPEECNGLTSANIYQNSVNLIDSRKRKKMKTSYRFNKHYLRKMSFVKKLSPCQKREILKAKRIIRKYEKVYGSNAQNSHLQQQKQSSFANEFSKNNSLKYYETEMEEGGNELGENYSCAWNDFDPEMQQMPTASNIFDYSGNYDRRRSRFPFNTNNDLEPEMGRIIKLPHFEPKLGSSKFTIMNKEDPQHFINLSDPKEGNFNGKSVSLMEGSKFISNIEKTFYQPAPQTVSQHNYPQDTRGNPITNDLRSQFASTSKNIFAAFSEKGPTANSSINFDKTEYPYYRRNNLRTEPETSSSIWRETPANTSNYFEQSAKIALEKRIYECLNALSEEDTTTEMPSFRRETAESSLVLKEPIDPQNALIAYPALVQLKQKSIALRKRPTDPRPTVEVISLTDDSEDSDILEIKSLNVEKAKSDMVKKYDKIFATTKAKKSTTDQTDGKRKSRWSFNTNTRQYSSQNKVYKSKELEEQQGFWKSGSGFFFPARNESAVSSAFRF